AHDGIEERGLARAVRADEPGDRAALHRERYVPVGDHAAVSLGDAADLDDRVGHAFATFGAGAGRGASAGSGPAFSSTFTPNHSGWRLFTHPRIPCWKKTTFTMMSSPSAMYCQPRRYVQVISRIA